jgi:expansin (peptidoglycan-binding protein)
MKQKQHMPGVRSWAAGLALVMIGLVLGAGAVEGGYLVVTLEPVRMGAAEPFLYLPMVRIANSPFDEAHHGEGTYYWEADGSGNCLFDPIPGDLMVAAMNQVDYDQAALCGAFIRVQGPQGAVEVRIVDRCPECPAGDVDLSPAAFVQIAPLDWGRVPISWQLISPELTGPIAYHFKDGSNQWWTAVQIRNHRTPIARLEYLDDGQFQEVARTEWNYFVKADGMGPGPYTFRVTDILGRTLTDSGIPHVENGTVAGSGQFPPP